MAHLYENTNHRTAAVAVARVERIGRDVGQVIMQNKGTPKAPALRSGWEWVKRESTWKDR
jgi:hypothetical protein